MNINTKKLTLQYCILQGAYWASFCIIYSFATVFLLDRGFRNSQIGVIIAAGNILGVIFQPVFASVVDRSKTVTLHKLTAILAAVMVVLLLLLYGLPNQFLAVALIFLLTDTLLQVIQPLINSVSVYYVNQGVNVDFGAARGIGSLSYALASYLLGGLVENYGCSMILFAGILMVLVICITVFSMPIIKDAVFRDKEQEMKIEINADRGQSVQEKESLLSFVGRYKYFMLTLAGVTLVFSFHNMNNSYMIQIITNVGGTSADLGRLLAIAAITEIPVMFLFSIIVKHVKSSVLLIISGIFFALKAFGYFAAGNIALMTVAAVMQMGSFAIYIPASVYYVNEVMEGQDKFKGQALMTGTNTLGGMIGSLLGGFLIDHAGVAVMNLAGLIMAVSGAVLITLFVSRQNPVIRK